MDFADIADRQGIGLGHLGGDLRGDVGTGRAFDKHELAVGDADVELAPAGGCLADQVDGHGVQHFIAEHGALETVGKTVEPHHLREGGQRQFLARAQFAG